MSTRDRADFEDVAMVHMPILLVIPLRVSIQLGGNWKDSMHEVG